MRFRPYFRAFARVLEHQPLVCGRMRE